MASPPRSSLLQKDDTLVYLTHSSKTTPNSQTANVRVMQGRIYVQTAMESKRKENKGVLKKVTKPGECVSVDQTESRTPGFIGMMRGFLTKQRYTCATVFADHYSDFTYTHLQRSTSMSDTLAAKNSFEAVLRRHGIKVLHYHADNGRFADKDFLQNIVDSRQTISFCGAYAHFQNGKVEKRIRDLQDNARTVLLHSVAKWPTASSVHLWGYALHYVTDLRNNIPQNHQLSPIELLTGVKISPRLNTFHTFGCPVYQLSTALQNGKKIPKWDPRCKLGLYLGNSPRHSRTVSNVLNLQTGRVSPQFHVQHDEFFETIKVTDKTLALWKGVAGFSKINKIYKDLDLPSPPVTSPPSQPLANRGQDLSSEPLPPDLDFVLPPEESPNIEPPMEPPNEPPPLLRRSTRRKEPTRALLDNISQQGYDFQEFRRPTYTRISWLSISGE